MINNEMSERYDKLSDSEKIEYGEFALLFNSLSPNVKELCFDMVMGEEQDNEDVYLVSDEAMSEFGLIIDICTN